MKNLVKYHSYLLSTTGLELSKNMIYEDMLALGCTSYNVRRFDSQYSKITFFKG